MSEGMRLGHGARESNCKRSRQRHSHAGMGMRAEIVIGGRMRDRRFGPISLIDRLFGYDFFLSYAHSDGQNLCTGAQEGT